ncbi:hypothetical protein A4R26_31815 [Niastella populi]|uniref:Uncharacterized protein n=2 Tax=Niastella populi TaxID=550983 RepID=A0A1V9EPF9_9BACT|nr:hypothetical protein A4R26_31815 [Niastella populi]
MAIAILIAGTVNAQTNTSVKSAQSANATNKADINKAGETVQSNGNVSADASANAQVKTDVVKQNKARAKKEGTATISAVADKKDKLQTETASATGTALQEASVNGKSNASINTQKRAAAEITTSSEVKTEAVQAAKSNIRKEGEAVVNATVETKKNVKAEADNTVKAVNKDVSGKGETNASIKAGKKVKVDAASGQEVKVKPSSIGVNTRVTSATGLNLR